jgi:hypothetical protein
MKWQHHPNLRRRPHAPNKGRGRLQRQLRRAFYGGTELTTSQVLDWTNVRNRQRLTGRHRYSVWRLLVTIADPIGRADTIGRPWVWRLHNTET